MSHQATHHHSLLNSIPQTHQQQQQPNHTATVKTENDIDDALSLAPVPKVDHTPENYDSDCECSTCQSVRGLMAECTCAKCRPGQLGTCQTVNQTVAQVSQVQPSSSVSSIISQNNDDSCTSEQHIHENDDQIDEEDDESGDSSSDDSGDDNDDDEDYDEDDDESRDSSSDDSTTTTTSHEKSDDDYVEEDDDNVDSTSDNESENSVNENTSDSTGVKCPKCSITFTVKHRLLAHYRRDHQQWKPYYCRGRNCKYTSDLEHLVILHVNRVHFKRENKSQAKTYVGKRAGPPPKDAVLEQIVAHTFDREMESCCPKCGRNLSPHQMKAHIRTHGKPGYRCAWPKCGFFYSKIGRARKHLCLDHLRVEKATFQQTKRYLVGKNFNRMPIEFNRYFSNCPKCGRNIKVRSNFAKHLRAHNKSGFRCTFRDCNFFFPNRQHIKNHILWDHFSGKLSDFTQLNQHFIAVNSNLAHYSSTSEQHIHENESGDSSSDDSGDDNDDDEDYDEDDNESRDSSSDDSTTTTTSHEKSDDDYVEEDDDNVDSTSDNESENSVNENTPDSTGVQCPKCSITFTVKHRLLAHYRRDHQQWKPYYCRGRNCNFTSDLEHLVILHVNRAHFKTENKSQAKTYVGKRAGTPPKDAVLEQIVAHTFDREMNSNCPQCGRNLSPHQMKAHIRIHGKPGYRCAWPKCGIFYSTIGRARKHLCLDHLRVEKATLQQIKRYLVRKNFHTHSYNCPKCGRNIKFWSNFAKHLRAHNKSGFRCTFRDCSFFFSYKQHIRNHILRDHFKSKLSDFTQLNQHFIAVDQNLAHDSSTSERSNDNDDDQHHDDPPSGSSTPDYHPRFFDDESSDSSSDDTEDDQENESFRPNGKVPLNDPGTSRLNNLKIKRRRRTWYV